VFSESIPLRESHVGSRWLLEADMRRRFFLGLCAVGIVYSSGVLATPLLSEGMARQEVLVLARQRLNHSANPNKSDANVRLDHADHASFFFVAHATRPCLPGQDVCSSLLGHFRVDRQSGAIFDEDTTPQNDPSAPTFIAHHTMPPR
jgi:hypothetical protein